MNGAVTAEQRHTRHRPCGVCGGGDDDTRGHDRRCYGFTSSDGEWCHCSREEHAGGLEQTDAGTYGHRLGSSCKCGVNHSGAVVRSIFAKLPRERDERRTHVYRDEHGALLFRVVIIGHGPGKKVFQEHPDGADRWKSGRNGAPYVLYRLPDVIAAADATTWITEGERDADELAARGVVATTGPGGAGKWHHVAAHARTVIADRDVVVFADNDEVGRKHARQVAAALRDVVRSLRIVVAAGGHKDAADLLAAGDSLADVVDLADEEEHEPAPETPAEPATRTIPSLAERVRELAELGPVVRLPTGIPTLDRACRGGLPTRRLVVIGGPPGGGKTTLTVHLAWQWARTRLALVVFVAIDEGPEGALFRIAQQEGIDVRQLEEGEGTALERLSRIVDDVPFVVADADDGLDSAGAILAFALPRARALGLPLVVVIDSAQTWRVRGVADAAAPRERIDTAIREAKILRDAGALVLVTSELARGAYRSRNPAERTDDLASFKESGSLEYSAQTALVLRSTPDAHGLIDVTVPKNRAYRRDPFRLSLDHVTTKLVEVDAPNDGPASATTARRHDIANDARAVYAAVLRSPGLAGVKALRAEMRNVSMGNARVDEALAWLRTRGAIDNRGTDARPRFHANADAMRQVATQEEGATDDE